MGGDGYIFSGGGWWWMVVGSGTIFKSPLSYPFSWIYKFLRKGLIFFAVGA